MDPIYISANDGIEDLENYQPGGLHPVLIGDKFQDDRYLVLHKLGSGGSSTVWLARDSLEHKYVALKMLSVRASHKCREVDIHRYLIQDQSFSTCPSITKILANFIVGGPNGQHLCIVLEVIGPNLQTLSTHFKVQPNCVRRLALQIARSLACIHQRDVAFGDLSTANILLRFGEIANWPEEQIYTQLGRPRINAVTIIEGKEAYKQHAPHVVYPSVDYRDVDTNILTPQIALTDFNEAVHVCCHACGHDHDTPSAVNWSFAAPEHLFNVDVRHTKASDIWALACCLFELRSNRKLLEGYSPMHIRALTQMLLRKQPPESWNAEGKIDPYGKDIELVSKHDCEGSEETLEVRLKQIGNWGAWHSMDLEERRMFMIEQVGEEIALDPPFHLEAKISTGSPPPAKLSVQELHDFLDLLSRMLVYEPKDRITIGEILEHPWLHKTYEDLDEPGPWVTRFDWGYDVEEEEYDEEELEAERGLLAQVMADRPPLPPEAFIRFEPESGSELEGSNSKVRITRQKVPDEDDAIFMTLWSIR